MLLYLKFCIFYIFGKKGDVLGTRTTQRSNK